MLDGAKFLCLDENGKPFKEIEAKGRKFSIGYLMDNNHIIADNGEAEKLHCQIECDAFGHVIISNKSEKNPIRVNGETVTIKRTLFNNSRIRILDKEYLWLYKAPACNANVVSENPNDMLTPTRQIGIPEQPPTSCPALKHHHALTTRLTMHNLRAYRVDSERNVNIDAIEDDKQTEINNLQDNPEEVSPQIQVLNLDSTPSKVDLVDSTTNKKALSTEKRLKAFRNSWGWSGMTSTSYSPRETGIRIEKTFTAIIPPTNPHSSLCRTPKGLLERLHLQGERQDSSVSELISFSTPKKTDGQSRHGIVVQHIKSAMKIVDLTTPNKLRTQSPLARPISCKKSTAVKSIASTDDKNRITENTHVTPLLNTPRLLVNDTPITSGSAITIDSSEASNTSEVADSSVVSSTTPLRANFHAATALRKQALLASAKKQAIMHTPRSPKTPSNLPIPVRKVATAGPPYSSTVRGCSSTQLIQSATTKEAKSREPIDKSKIPAMRRLDISTTKPPLSPVTIKTSDISNSTSIKMNEISTTNRDVDVGLVKQNECKNLATSTPYKVEKVEQQIPTVQVEAGIELFETLHSSNEEEVTSFYKGNEKEFKETVPTNYEKSVNENDDLMKEIEEILNTSDELKKQLQTTEIVNDQDLVNEDNNVIESTCKSPTLSKSTVPMEIQTTSNTTPTKNSLSASILLKAINSVDKNKSKTQKEDEEKENKVNDCVSTPVRRRISLSTSTAQSMVTVTPAINEEVNFVAGTPLTPKRVTKRRPSISLENDEIPVPHISQHIIDAHNTENMGAILEEEDDSLTVEVEEGITSTPAKLPTDSLLDVTTIPETPMVLNKNELQNVQDDDEDASTSLLHCSDENFAELLKSEDQNESANQNIAKPQTDVKEIYKNKQQEIDIQLLEVESESKSVKEKEITNEVLDENFAEIEHAIENDADVYIAEKPIVGTSFCGKEVEIAKKETDETSKDQELLDESFGQIEFIEPEDIKCAEEVQGDNKKWTDSLKISKSIEILESSNSTEANITMVIDKNADLEKECTHTTEQLVQEDVIEIFDTSVDAIVNDVKIEDNKRTGNIKISRTVSPQLFEIEQALNDDDIKESELNDTVTLTVEDKLLKNHNLNETFEINSESLTAASNNEEQNDVPQDQSVAKKDKTEDEISQPISLDEILFEDEQLSLNEDEDAQAGTSNKMEVNQPDVITEVTVGKAICDENEVSRIKLSESLVASANKQNIQNRDFIIEKHEEINSIKESLSDINVSIINTVTATSHKELAIDELDDQGIEKAMPKKHDEIFSQNLLNQKGDELSSISENSIAKESDEKEDLEKDENNVIILDKGDIETPKTTTNKEIDTKFDELSGIEERIALNESFETKNDNNTDKSTRIDELKKSSKETCASLNEVELVEVLKLEKLIGNDSEEENSAVDLTQKNFDVETKEACEPSSWESKQSETAVIIVEQEIVEKQQEMEIITENVETTTSEKVLCENTIENNSIENAVDKASSNEVEIVEEVNLPTQVVDFKKEVCEQDSMVSTLKGLMVENDNVENIESDAVSVVALMNETVVVGTENADSISTKEKEISTNTSEILEKQISNCPKSEKKAVEKSLIEASTPEVVSIVDVDDNSKNNSSTVAETHEEKSQSFVPMYNSNEPAPSNDKSINLTEAIVEDQKDKMIVREEFGSKDQTEKVHQTEIYDLTDEEVSEELAENLRREIQATEGKVETEKDKNIVDMSNEEENPIEEGEIVLNSIEADNTSDEGNVFNYSLNTKESKSEISSSQRIQTQIEKNANSDDEEELNEKSREEQLSNNMSGLDQDVVEIIDSEQDDDELVSQESDNKESGNNVHQLEVLKINQERCLDITNEPDETLEKTQFLGRSEIQHLDTTQTEAEQASKHSTDNAAEEKLTEIQASSSEEIGVAFEEFASKKEAEDTQDKLHVSCTEVLKEQHQRHSVDLANNAMLQETINEVENVSEIAVSHQSNQFEVEKKNVKESQESNTAVLSEFACTEKAINTEVHEVRTTTEIRKELQHERDSPKTFDETFTCEPTMDDKEQDEEIYEKSGNFEKKDHKEQQDKVVESVKLDILPLEREEITQDSNITVVVEEKETEATISEKPLSFENRSHIVDEEKNQNKVAVVELYIAKEDDTATEVVEEQAPLSQKEKEVSTLEKIPISVKVHQIVDESEEKTEPDSGIADENCQETIKEPSITQRSDNNKRRKDDIETKSKTKHDHSVVKKANKANNVITEKPVNTRNDDKIEEEKIENPSEIEFPLTTNDTQIQSQKVLESLTSDIEHQVESQATETESQQLFEKAENTKDGVSFDITSVDKVSNEETMQKSAVTEDKQQSIRLVRRGRTMSTKDESQVKIQPKKEPIVGEKDNEQNVEADNGQSKLDEKVNVEDAMLAEMEAETGELPQKPIISENKEQNVRRGRRARAESVKPKEDEETIIQNQVQEEKPPRRLRQTRAMSVSEDTTKTIEEPVQLKSAENVDEAETTVEVDLTKLKAQKSNTKRRAPARRGKQASNKSQVSKKADKLVQIEEEIITEHLEILKDETVDSIPHQVLETVQSTEKDETEQKLIDSQTLETENRLDVSTRSLRRRAAVKTYEISSDSDDDLRHTGNRKRRGAKGQPKHVLKGEAETINNSKTTASRKKPAKEEQIGQEGVEPEESKRTASPKKRARKKAEPAASSTLISEHVTVVRLMEAEDTINRDQASDLLENTLEIEKNLTTTTTATRNRRGATKNVKYNEDDDDDITKYTKQTETVAAGQAKVTKTTKRKVTNARGGKTTKTAQNVQLSVQDDKNTVDDKIPEIIAEKIELETQPKVVPKRKGKLTNAEIGGQENKITVDTVTEIPPKRRRRQSAQSEQQEEIPPSTITPMPKAELTKAKQTTKKPRARRGKQANETETVLATSANDEVNEVKTAMAEIPVEIQVESPVKKPRSGRRGKQIDTVQTEAITEKRRKVTKANIDEKEEENNVAEEETTAKSLDDIERPQPESFASTKTTRSRRGKQKEPSTTEVNIRRKQLKSQKSNEAEESESLTVAAADDDEREKHLDEPHADGQDSHGLSKRQLEITETVEPAKSARTQRRKHVHFDEAPAKVSTETEIITSSATENKSEQEVKTTAPKRRRRR